jgi:phosphohistidine swiveling domain-containing protein
MTLIDWSETLARFPGDEPAALERVGGKGQTLMQLAQAGMPVPPGVIVTAECFAPWFSRLRETPEWAVLREAPPEHWSAQAEALKTRAVALASEQPDQLTSLLVALRARLREQGTTGLVAVRSSSPDEDLTGASFAGGYETSLGVRVDDDEAVVRALLRCFASSLDARVFHYKRVRGHDVFSPSIAVIVQRQLRSDVAGVGFSVNPVSNDHDEAVIDASWGLGEAVVAGRVTPDHFVVDTVSGAVLERAQGDKRVAIRLAPEGGTLEGEATANERAAPALTDEQLRELCGLMAQVEEQQGRPVDIEWAYEDGVLRLLQARPITTTVPLPPALMTAPGERRRLYADVSLSKGLTINAPLSPLGLDWMKDSFFGLIENFIGPVARDLPPDESILLFAGGRMYTNLSNQLLLQKPKAMAAGVRATDVLMAELFESIDRERYKAEKRPPWMRLGTLRVIPRALWRLRSFSWNLVRGYVAPARAHRGYVATLDAIERRVDDLESTSESLAGFRSSYLGDVARDLFSVLMPALLVGLGSFDRLIPRRWPDAERLRAALSRGYPGNVVVEMGVALHGLARALGSEALADPEGLARRVERRELAPGQQRAWDEFMARFGWRGPGEMDLASPRYADDPRLAIQQMAGMSLDDPATDPEDIHVRNVQARRAAYEEALRRSRWLRRWRLRRRWRTTQLFAGTRDTPKHVNVRFGYGLRRLALRRGEDLVRAGRLDAAAEVFDLELAELDRAAMDSELDLRARRRGRIGFLEQLRLQVRAFPAVIDSRGRILRPAPRGGDEVRGELRGMAVSSGHATGRVKLLCDARTGVVEPGEVVVAYTTDPGWTPLFANASAVLLEVGGVLQHGAVVARELGKPCVVGIDRLLTRLRDGQRVEVDGSAGVVRVLDGDEVGGPDS